MRKFDKLDKQKIESNNLSDKEKIQEEVKEIINNFGKAVKDARNKKNINLKELSQKSGVSTSVISDLELGKEKIPNLYTLVALAKTLEMNNDTFIKLIFGEIIHTEPNAKKPIENLQDALIACGVPCDVANNITASVQLFYGKDRLELGGLYSNPRARLIQQNQIDLL